LSEELKITIKRKHINFLKNFLKPEAIVFFMFVIAGLLYINIDKVPLSHPGNLKASDTFAHVLTIESILDTKQWDYYDFYMSLGNERMSNIQPPLYYMNAAVLTTFSKVPPWVTFYFLVSLSQAFFVIAVFLLTRELFNKTVALIAAALSVLPLPLNVWLYPLYIGIWIQVCAYALILCFFWLFIKYLKTKKPVLLFFMSVCISSITLTHTADIILLFIPSLYIAFTIFIEFLKDKNIKPLITKTALFSIIPLIILIILIPKFVFVWSSYSGSASYSIGWQNIKESFFIPGNATAALVFPHLNLLPLWQVILSVAGIFLLILGYFYPYKIDLKMKKKISVIGKKINTPKLYYLFLLLYFFVFVYFAEYFITKPYYVGRMRSLQPYLLYPFLAFSIYSILHVLKLIVFSSLITSADKPRKMYKELQKKDNAIMTFSALIVVILILVFNNAIPQYSSIVSQMQYEHVPLGQWLGYRWIHQNVGVDEKVLFVGVHGQSEGLYSKRINGIFAYTEFTDYIARLSSTGLLETDIKISGWGGSTPRSNIIEYGFWNFGRIPEPSHDVSLYDFDYLFFMDVNQQMTQINDALSSLYIDNLSFTRVYDQNGYMILRVGEPA